MLGADRDTPLLIPAAMCEVSTVLCLMSPDSLCFEAEATPVVDVAALLGGDCSALLLHHHIALL